MTERDYLTEPVQIQPGAMRLSADAMRSLRKATGRAMTELLQDDEDEANRFQVMAFAHLWRRANQMGHMPDPATLWEAAGAVEVEFIVEDIDPLKDGSSTTSPPSATSGE